MHGSIPVIKREGTLAHSGKMREIDVAGVLEIENHFETIVIKTRQESTDAKSMGNFDEE